MNRMLLSSAALLAICCAHVAAAQEQQPAAPAKPDVVQSADNGQDNQQLDVIIVTATKRSQNLQDVPIAISAIGAAEIKEAQITDIRELQRLSPSLFLTSTSAEAAGTTARIRGIGTTGDNPGLESSVAVIVDGVYRNRNSVGFTELGEIERIEVARGPQGTLFGRNASAGLINVVSKGPSYNLGGYGEASYGNYNYGRVAGGVTGGVIPDKLALRLDGVWLRRDGFYNDAVTNQDYNNRKRWLLRGQALVEPTESLSIRIIGDYAKRTEDCCAASTIVRGSTAAIVEALGGRLQSGAGGRSSTDPYDRISATTPGRTLTGNVDDWGVQAETTWRLENMTATAITSYRDWQLERGQDADYTSLDLFYRAPIKSQEFRTFQQEVRLQGSALDKRLDWLVGGLFANEILNYTDNVRTGADYQRFQSALLGTAIPGFGPTAANPGGGFATIARLGGFTGDPSNLFGQNTLNADFRQRSRNFAFFTHDVFKVTDKLSFTLGARYTNENKELNANLTGSNPGCTATLAGLSRFLALLPAASRPTAQANIVGLACLGVIDPLLNGAYNGTRKESQVTGTAVVSYKFNDQLNAYFSYARGYKAGGFNLDRGGLSGPPTSTLTPNQAQLQFPQETVNSYEGGLKFHDSDARLTINFAAFYEGFRNFQLNTFNGLSFIVAPIPKVTTGGVEVETSYRPVNILTLNLGATIADARYTRNLTSALFAQPTSATSTPGVLFQLPGRRITNAPQVSLSGSASLKPPIIQDKLDGLLHIDFRYNSSYNTGSDLDLEKQQAPYIVVNARAGVNDPDGVWGVEFWVLNVFDKDYTQVAFDAPFQGSGTRGNPFTANPSQTFNAFLAEPRTFGVTLRGRF